MKKILILLFLFGYFSTNAQKADSIDIKITILYKPNKLNLTKSFIKINETNRRIKSLILPTGFIAYGFISLENYALKKLDKSTNVEIEEHHPQPVTKIDNYLQYSPALAVYGLNALGIKSKNNFRDRTIIYALSTAISAAIVLPLKRITRIQRPDGSGLSSFPSGHTTTAFAAAEFMRQEYKDVSLWYAIVGYGAATATGILRLYNNKHWLSDVVAGAGFGILSTKLSYWFYPVIKRKVFKNKSKSTMVIPFIQNNGGGLSMVYHF